MAILVFFPLWHVMSAVRAHEPFDTFYPSVSRFQTYSLQVPICKDALKRKQIRLLNQDGESIELTDIVEVLYK